MFCGIHPRIHRTHHPSLHDVPQKFFAFVDEESIRDVETLEAILSTPKHFFEFLHLRIYREGNEQVWIAEATRDCVGVCKLSLVIGSASTACGRGNVGSSKPGTIAQWLALWILKR